MVNSEASATQGRIVTGGSDDAQPDWLTSFCPRCDGVLVSALRYVPGRGYHLRLVCAEADCEYERSL